VPPPPVGVNTNLPPTTEAHPQTNRERMSDHVSNPACASCHNLVDPIGWGLEKFDAVGARREDLKLTFANMSHGGGNRRAPQKSVVLPLNTEGNVLGIADSTFSSPRELGSLLAKTQQCQECIVKQYYRYAAGRMETVADRPIIDRIYQDFKNSNFNFKQMMVSLIRAREFPGEERSVRVASNH
jgi:hypothetical protein